MSATSTNKLVLDGSAITPLVDSVGFFNSASLAALSRTNLALCKAFSSKATERLLQHVVYGEEDEAMEMLKANPELLLIKSNVQDYSGRTIVATPFQAAIAAEDERMWEMMEPYFDKLETKGKIESALAERKAQFDAQFPASIEDEGISSNKALT